MNNQAVIRFDATRTLRRGPHARKVLITNPIRATVDVANEHSAAIVRKLAALAAKAVRHG